MQSASHASDASPTGRVRNATLLDARALSILIARNPTTRLDPLDLLVHGHLLVLDLGHGTLGAAVHIDVVDNLAAIDLLVVDPALRGRQLAERMAGVAHAMCEAHGYVIAESSGSPAASRGR